MFKPVLLSGLSATALASLLAAPATAKIVNRPRIFADPRTGAVSGLWPGGDHGPGTQKTSLTDRCHDITVFPEKGLAAGACSGTGLLLDLGGGQLAVCKVTRAQDAQIAVEFETPLVSDGAGGLVTRHRVSPYALAAAGMPLTTLPQGNYPLQQIAGPPKSKPQFMQVTVSGMA